MTTIEESIDIEVPVAVAYNQWTQFESFPSFMDGVDRVEQKTDTTLHWVAKIGGAADDAKRPRASAGSISSHDLRCIGSLIEAG